MNQTTAQLEAHAAKDMALNNQATLLAEHIDTALEVAGRAFCKLKVVTSQEMTVHIDKHHEVSISVPVADYFKVEEPLAAPAPDKELTLNEGELFRVYLALKERLQSGMDCDEDFNLRQKLIATLGDL